MLCKLKLVILWCGPPRQWDQLRLCGEANSPVHQSSVSVRMVFLGHKLLNHCFCVNQFVVITQNTE